MFICSLLFSYKKKEGKQEMTHKKSSANLSLMKRDDWHWFADSGLVDKKLHPISRQDPRANRLLVGDNKSLVVISHHYCRKKLQTEAHVIGPSPLHKGVPLQMLSDILFTFLPRGSEFGLEDMTVNAEDEHSVVSFVYFDH